MKPGPSRQTRKISRWVLAAALVAALFAAGQQLAARSGWLLVHVGGHPIQVEVADDDRERTRGLMHRTELAADAGMLFVYPEPQPLSFWMKDTPLDLDIAFFDAEGRLLNIETMRAFDDVTLHHSAGPARYALETRRGWFAKQDIRPGAVLRLPPAPSGR